MSEKPELLDRPPYHKGCDCAVTYTNFRMSGVSMMRDGSIEPEGTFDGYELLLGKNCHVLPTCGCHEYLGRPLKSFDEAFREMKKPIDEWVKENPLQGPGLLKRDDLNILIRKTSQVLNAAVVRERLRIADLAVEMADGIDHRESVGNAFRANQLRGFAKILREE